MQDEIQKMMAEELGIAGLGSEEQQKMIADFGGLALKSASIAVLAKLPEEKRAQFTALADAGDGAALKTFLDAEVPDHEAVSKAAVAEEIRRFKEFQGGV